jgi:hypothetical protein
MICFDSGRWVFELYERKTFALSTIVKGKMDLDIACQQGTQATTIFE